MSSKLKDAASRLVREIEDGMLVELSSKFEHDLAKTLLADVKSALAEPLRNCDVGTADEQRRRHWAWCRKHGLDGDGKANCLGRDMSCSRCVLLWSQRPYKKEGEE